MRDGVGVERVSSPPEYKKSTTEECPVYKCVLGEVFGGTPRVKLFISDAEFTVPFGNCDFTPLLTEIWDFTPLLDDLTAILFVFVDNFVCCIVVDVALLEVTVEECLSIAGVALLVIKPPLVVTAAEEFLSIVEAT